MPRVLRDELEGVDFYIAQGYVEIARDTLDRLREENGDHPEILARYKRLGESFDTLVDESVESKPTQLPVAESVHSGAGASSISGIPSSLVVDGHAEELSPQLKVSMSDEEVESADYEQGEPALTESGPGEREEKPFVIEKESGPLYPDLLVQLNTSELLSQTPFDTLRPLTGPPLPAEERLGTGDLIESIVSSIDTSIDAIHHPREETLPMSEQPCIDASPPENESSPGDNLAGVARPLDAVDSTEGLHDSGEVRSAGDELREIFNELKEHTGDLEPLVDFETHYSLGLAYKDMDLLDEAIAEFQMSFRMAGLEDLQGDYIHCCHMLGVCFKRKQTPKVAIMWFERGLKIRNRLEDEYQALRFEIGLCYEEMGEIDRAVEAFMQVYGTDVNYRKVGEKIKQLQAEKR
jgi:tetratricopeptide (TPR) repeat protein